MSYIQEHMANQDALTARYNALTKIGLLAHEFGTDIDLCEDVDEALDYCAGRLDKINVRQLRIYDEARMDAYEDQAWSNGASGEDEPDV